MQNIKEIDIDAKNKKMTITADSTWTIVINAATVSFENLPTSDPSVAKQVYADSNVLTLSAG